MDRLYCAREAAQSGRLNDLVASIKLVEQWPTENPLYGEAQGLLADWSAVLLTTARQQIERGDFDGAIATTQYIPTKSPNYADVEAAVSTWKQQWQDGEAVYAKAEAALKVHNWDEAARQLSTLGQLQNRYWRQQRVDELAQQIILERQAWKMLTDARNLAKGNPLERLGSAIALAEKVNQQTFTWAEAKTNIEQWSTLLLNGGSEKRNAGDFDAAIALASQIPDISTLASEAKDLIEFSSAQKLARQSTSAWHPSLVHVLNLLEATKAARQVEPNGSLYAEAQANVQDWEQQLTDLIQLQYANIFAGIGHHSTLQMAVHQATQIEAGRSRRTQAQTLIAHWTQEIQRIEDRPIIARARQLAEPGTIPAFKTAIAEASKVQMGRALRNDAQTWVANWTNQIEIIEDTPTLEEARSLASQGSLSRAIDVAGRIGAERALYGEARSAIRRWRYEILVAQDSRTLDQARSLAAELSLTRAIDVASQIGAGRPLYSEAQGAIADWQAQRAQIWADQEAAQQSSSDYYDDGYSSDGYSDDSGYEDSGDYNDGYYDESY